jgi:hypothetical protein
MPSTFFTTFREPNRSLREYEAGPIALATGSLACLGGGADCPGFAQDSVWVGGLGRSGQLLI